MKTLLWNVDVLVDHEIIELIYQGNKAFALIKEVRTGYESIPMQDVNVFKLAKFESIFIYNIGKQNKF